MKKVLLLLANGFEIYEASAFIDVIGWNYLEGDGSTKLYSCGITKEVSSTFDQRFIVDYLLDEIDTDGFDALAIPGGFEEYDFYRDGYSDKFQNIIREFNSEGKPIATICVGALLLGKSGILKGREATTYGFGKSIRQSQLKDFAVNVVNRSLVVDGNIITSWNPSTAIDVAYLLLEKLTSKENVDRVKELMGFR